MTTCERSPETGSAQMELFPPSSLDRPPARSIRPPTARAAGSMAMTSSLNSSDLLLNLDPVGHALKTALASELSALTGSPVNLRARGTPAGHTFWELSTSAHRTSESARGSSRTGTTLPTPLSHDPMRGPRKPDGKRGRDLLTETRTMLPTPRRTDADKGGRGDLIQVVRGNKANSEHGDQRMLPTPRASDHSGWDTPRSGRMNGLDLPGTLKLLATPTARDWRSGKASEATHARNSRLLNEQLERKGLGGTAVLAAISTWLMGWPAEWLAGLPPPPATRSSRRSRK